MSAWKHFKTITHHKLLVAKHCFKVGLYWQGLTHDLSKYSPTEFRIGAKYYQGTRSPNAAEREDRGYSTAWMHHKGRNRHHYEYWSDLNLKTGRYQVFEMPRRFFAEMVMDRIAASKIYQGENYRDSDSLAYLNRCHERSLMHPETQRQLTVVLTLLAEQGEAAAFRFIREVVLTGKPF